MQKVNQQSFWSSIKIQQSGSILKANLFSICTISSSINIIHNSNEIYLKQYEKKLASFLNILIEEFQNLGQAQEKVYIAKLYRQLKNKLQIIENSQRKLPYLNSILSIHKKMLKEQSQIENFTFSVLNLSAPKRQGLKHNEIYLSNFCTEFSNENFKKIEKEQLKIDPLICPLCASKFIYNDTIEVNKCDTDRVIFLSKQQSRNIQNIHEWICSFANKSGGTIFIGINSKKMNVKGVKHSENTFLSLKKKIQNHQVHPKQFKSLKIDAVPIHENLTGGTKEGLCVIRIHVIMKKPKKMYYIWKQKKNFKSLPQIYVLNKNQEKQKLQKEDIYTFMVKRFHTAKPYKNLHYQSKCKQPEKQLFLETDPSENNPQIYKEVEEIQLKHKYQSIVKIAENKIEFLEKLKKLMKQNNLIFQILKPFRSIQRQNGWYFELICHQIPISKMKELLPSYERKEVPISEITKFIRTQNMVEKKFKLLEASYELRFDEKIRKKYHQKKDNKYINLTFKPRDKIESIFIYIHCQTQNLRSEFIQLD